MDASLIQQAITNLLENAIHHTKKKDGVAVILERKGNDAVFTVRDRGMGINPEHLDRLFEPFYQSNRSDQVVYRGFGLGLSICNSIRECPRRRILARNRKDASGAENNFYVAYGGRTVKQTKELIMIVEDDRQIQDFIAYSLMTAGFGVLTAGGVEEAMRKMRSKKPDIMVLDLGLPDGDGLDLIRRVRKFSDIPDYRGVGTR